MLRSQQARRRKYLNNSDGWLVRSGLACRLLLMTRDPRHQGMLAHDRSGPPSPVRRHPGHVDPIGVGDNAGSGAPGAGASLGERAMIVCSCTMISDSHIEDALVAILRQPQTPITTL